MASLNDGLTTGTADAAGAAGATVGTGSASGVATGVAGTGAGCSGAGAGCTGAAGATATANAAAAMGATADAGAALLADSTGAAGAAGADTSIVIISTGAGSAGAPGATSTSTEMAVMVGMANSGTARTMGTASQEDPDETHASISLPTPKYNLAKDLDKTPNHEHRRLAVQLQAFLLQDSPDLTQLNDAENKPVVGIINIPKSSTIQVLHSFGVGINPIGGYSPIAVKILSLVGDGSSANPPQAMVLPR